MILQNGKCGISFSNMGEFGSEGTWRHPERTLDSYELIAVTRGTVYLRIGNENRTLTKGDVVCLPPNVPHGGWKESTGVTFFWIHFTAIGFEQFGWEKIHCSAAGTSAFFREMSHWAESGHTEVAEIRLFFFLMEHSIRETGNKLVSDAAEYIRVHIADGVNVETVSARFGYSPDHLSKCFKKTYGKTLKQYMDDERLRKVKDYLLDSSLTIAEIARKTGFSSADAMLRFFRYQESTTPTAYRNSRFASHTNRN